MGERKLVEAQEVAMVTDCDACLFVHLFITTSFGLSAMTIIEHEKKLNSITCLYDFKIIYIWVV